MSGNFINSPLATVKVQLTDSLGLATLISAATANIPSAVAGYAIGCICMDETTGLGYMNTGSATSCTFTAFNSASAFTLPSAFTDATTTTSAGFAITDSAITTGSAFKVLNGNTTNFTTGASLIWSEMGAAVAGNGLKITTSAAYTGTGLAILTAGAMTTGVLLQLTSTTGLTTGSLLRATTSTAGELATNGAISIRATGDYTSNTAALLDVSASATTAGRVVNIAGAALTTGIALSITGAGAYTGTGFINVAPSGLTTGTAMLLTLAAITTGNGISIAASGAGQTSHSMLNLTQTTTTTGYTGALAKITSSSTTGDSQGLLVTMVNTVAGDGIKVVSNALTLGAGTGINVSHTTSVLGAGTSLVRIKSTGVDTGTTTGVLLDLQTTACAGSTQLMLTDSSADTAARIGILSKVTNAAAVLARPFQSSNVAVVNSKFTKHMVFTDGTKVFTMWLSQDKTDPNGTLTGVEGDVCFNGPNNKPYYCTVSGTTWATIV